jgi:hypothetical protein
VKGEAGVDRAASNERQVDGHGRGGSAASAGIDGEVCGSGRIPHVARPRDDRRASPDDRPPTLELVDREIDAVSEESRERRLDALSAHQTGKVTVLAAGEREQPAIDAGGPGEDGVARELEKVVRPVLEPAPEGPTRFVDGDRPPKEARKGREQARSLEGLPEPDHAVGVDGVRGRAGTPGRLSRSSR